MERFNEQTGKYENTNAVNMSPQLTEDEQHGVKLSSELAEHQSTVSKLNSELDHSQAFLDNSIQEKAEYQVKVDLIKADKSLNVVQVQTQVTVLANKHKGLQAQLDLAQNTVNADTASLRKANANLLLAKNAHATQLSKITNTPTPEEVEGYKLLKRSTMPFEMKKEIVDRMGMEFYNSIPMT